MASQLTLSIVTPERELVRVQADEVELPGSEGYFGDLMRLIADTAIPEAEAA